MPRRLRAAFLVLILAGFGFIGAVNASVRLFGGGEPHPLSPFFLEEKLSALSRLAVHRVHCLFDPHPDPSVILSRAAARHRVPKALLLSVARAESNLEPHRISHAGAMGLMQLMPETAAWLGVTDPFDTEENAEAAARYFRILSARYRGDAGRMAAAYNAGPARVPRRGPLTQLPGETRHYVKRVIGGL